MEAASKSKDSKKRRGSTADSKLSMPSKNHSIERPQTSKSKESKSKTVSRIESS